MVTMLAASLMMMLAPAGPSFRCDGAVSATEKLICGDAELSAYDRAMAFAWSHKWRPKDVPWASQTAWLKRRNDCGGVRQCVFDAYQAWINGLDSLDDNVVGASLTRVGDGPNAYGDLRVQALGDDWYIVSAQAAHFPEGDTSDLGAEIIHLVNGTATEAECSVTFQRLSGGGWRLKEYDASCSGLGSTLTGIYRP